MIKLGRESLREDNWNANDYLRIPFENRVNDKDFVNSKCVMKILTGIVGQGKTYSVANNFTPYLAEEKNVEIFIVSFPTTDILDKDDFEAALIPKGFGIAYHPKDVIRLAENGIKKIILLITHQGLVVSEQGKDFLDWLKNSGKEYAVFIDEAHTWLISHEMNYRDVNGNSNVNYEAKMFKKLAEMSTHSPYIFGLTATPNAEQFGKVKTIGGMTFELINKLPPLPVMLPKSAYFRSEKFYDEDFNTEKDDIDEIYEDAIVKNFLAPTKIKKTMMVSVGNRDAKTGYNKDYVKELTQQILYCQSLVGEDEKVIALMTGQKKETGIYSINGSFEKLDENDIKKKLNDNDDPLRIVIVVQKGKMGMNIYTLKTLFSFKPQNKKDSSGTAILELAIQTLGRLVRLNTGLSKVEFAKKYEYDLLNYMNTLTKEERNEVLEANAIDIYVPDTRMYREAVRVFKNEYVSTIQDAKFFYHENSRISS